MKLGMEAGLGPGHIVLDGTQLPTPKGAQPPIFGPYLLWPNCWMDQDDNWHGRRPHCAGFWSQLPLQKKGTVVPPKVMFIVAKWPDASGDIVR